MQISTPNHFYLLIGGIVLILSLSSRFIKQRLWISEPLAAMTAGALLGPLGLGLMELSQDSDRMLSEVARLTVALSIAGVALRLPDTYLRSRWRPALVVVLVVMPIMWLIASAAAWTTLGLSVLAALWLGAVVTPTDPVLADAIVTGELAEREIDEDVRHLISFESGANDGLAFLLVMLPLALMDHSWGGATWHWLTSTLLRHVLLAIALGCATGYAVGRAIRAALGARSSDPTALLASNASLVLVLLGGASLIATDGLIAVFAGVLVLNWLVRDDHAERQQETQEVITRYFDAPVFILFGLALPVDGWREKSWPLLAFVGGVLLFRRIPAIALARRALGPLGTWRQTLFMGWFGPIGAAALVYATWARERPGGEDIWLAASAVVCGSVVLHGITATPFTHWFARASRRVDESAHGRPPGARAPVGHAPAPLTYDRRF